MARAATSSYSSALSDLQKDSSFNAAKYPPSASDYSLQVIQIAESTAGELLIYVYQPSGRTANLRATTVRISQTLGNDLALQDYKLTYLNAVGVFFKYRVDGLNLKTDDVRYYNITAIHRNWIQGKDDEPKDDNTIDEVPFAVGQVWTVSTLQNGEITYKMEVTDVVEIKPEQKHVGHYRYSNGWGTWDKACDSHYVAFTADRPIDTLYEADVEFKSRCYYDTMFGKTNFGVWEDGFARLTDRQYVDEEPTGLFGGGNSRNYCRIESVSDFFKNVTDSGVLVEDEDRQNLAGMQWVLRFYESNVRADGGGNHCREVGKVSILRLKFETDGVVYNLGVVDSKRSGSIDPENRQPDFWDWLANLLGVPRWAAQLIFAAIILAIALPIIYHFLPIVRPVFAAVGNAILWVITAPFRFIAWLIRRKRKPATTSKSPKKEKKQCKEKRKTPHGQKSVKRFLPSSSK